MKRRRIGQALTEAAAQVDDRHDDAAQIEHAAHVIGLTRQVGDFRPALDFAHRHDVDAVLIVADSEADGLRLRGCDARRSSDDCVVRIEFGFGSG